MQKFLKKLKLFLLKRKKYPKNKKFFSIAEKFLKSKKISQQKFSRPYLFKKGFQAEKIWILITPWLETAVPFFSYEIAEHLSSRKNKIGLIFDYTSPFNEKYSSKYLRLIQTLEKLASNKYFVQTRETPKKIQMRQSRIHLLKSSIIENLIRFSKNEKEVISNPKIINENLEKIKNYFSDICCNLKNANVKKLIIPGGIYGLSFIYCYAAQYLKIKYWTYDSGDNCLTLVKNGIAGHFPQFKKAFDMAKKISKQKKVKSKILKSVMGTLQERIEGKDLFRLQPAWSNREKIESDVLLLLNYRLDTAAMSQNRVFKSSSEWIEETAKLCNQKNFKLIIKQHPCEKYKKFRSNESFFYLEKQYPQNVKYINYKMQINTYELIKKTKVVVPFSSRTGIEAYLFGKPIISHTNAFFDKLPFVTRAKNKSDYFNLIQRLVKTNSFKIQKKSEALLAYFLFEKCGFIKTKVTPIPANFIKWASTFTSLKDPNFGMFIDCIDNSKNLYFELFKKQIK